MSKKSLLFYFKIYLLYNFFSLQQTIESSPF